jgi:hypothetical protein
MDVPLKHAPFYLIICVCLAVSYFSTLSHKRKDFREKVLNIKCAFNFLYNVCLRHLILKELSEILSKMYITLSLHVKYHLLLLDFNKN